MKAAERFYANSVPSPENSQSERSPPAGGVVNHMTRAHEYRMFSEECIQQASKSGNPEDKANWLKLAEEWTRLAREAERRPEAF
jgi:hypothetical protein